MKRILAALSMVLLLAGCAKEYDDSAIVKRLDDMEKRLSQLESAITAIQSTQTQGVFVQKVEELKEGGKTIGVTVTYTNGDVYTIMISGGSAAEGPVLGVKANDDGVLCWAIDGNIVQFDGKDLPLYETPAFEIGADGHLYVTVNGKKSDIGPVQGTLQDGIVKDIAVEGDVVKITVEDGVIELPLAKAFQLVIDKTTYQVTSLDPIEIPYTLKNAPATTEVNVFVANGFTAVVHADKIVVTPPSIGAKGNILVYADSKVGLTSIVLITFSSEAEPDTFEPGETPTAEATAAGVDYIAAAPAGNLEIKAIANIPFVVKPQDTWIHYVETKANVKTIVLQLDENTTDDIRVGEVKIVRSDNEETTLLTYKIAQKPAASMPALSEAIDLGAQGTANSYMIPATSTAGAAYKFKAVRGNSTTSVGAVASASVIWETWNDDSEVTKGSVVSAVKAIDGYIEILMPAALHAGNALVAALDDAGAVLWSWHIWVPADAVVSAAYGGDFGADAMDRNLGALVVTTATDGQVDPLSYGLFYEWGRKDPFPGPNGYKGEDGASVAGQEMTRSNACITIDESIASPWLYSYAEGGNCDWTTDQASDLWENSGKTIYDPCPPGYRVPIYDETKPVWSGALTGGVLNAEYWIQTPGGAVIPYAGYMDDNGGTHCHVYDRLFIWSANSQADLNRGYGLDFRAGALKSTSTYKARGASVRCVVDGTVTPPDPSSDPSGDPGDLSTAVDLSASGTANCYIVPVDAAGGAIYKIKAVKGNSDNTVGEAQSATVVWETFCSSTAPATNSVIKAADYKDGYVYFMLPATVNAGNAVIAAQDSEGDYLWSWHIWIPSTPIEVGTYGIAVRDIMDRNLGALAVVPAEGVTGPESDGLLYQWGRKDPFPGYVGGGQRAFVSVAGEARNKVSEAITVAESIADPVKYPGTAGAWASDGDNDAWGATKTIHDPCPAGYRVPLASELTIFDGNTESITYEQDNYRFVAGTARFPHMGYINADGSDSRVTRSLLWTAESAADATASALYLYEGPGAGTSHSKSCGGGIRCIAE